MTLIGLLVVFWRHLSRRRHHQFVLLAILMLVSALAELVSLGAVLPFLGIFFAPERVFDYPFIAYVAQAWGLNSADQLVLPFAFTFIAATLVAGSIRLLFMWASTRFSWACGADLSIEVYRRTLYQPYRVHVSRNSSEVINSIDKVDGAVNALSQFLALISSAVMLVTVSLTLMAIDPVVTFAAVFGFGSSYWLIFMLSSQSLYRNSQVIAVESTNVLKSLQEGLSGIRDVLIDGTQQVYCDMYRKADLPTRRAQGDISFISQSPRYIMESVAMVLIVAFAFSLRSQDGGIATAVPVLGVMALGAQRLLPAVQRIYSVWAGIAGSLASLADVGELLNQPLPGGLLQPAPSPLLFDDEICFNAVRFRYNRDGPWVLDGLNLIIPRGVRIGFVGATGSGKSTMLDLLMGLLIPNEGEILVDGQPISGNLHIRAWQRNIAHVPQNVYLADTSIAENIAFGVLPDAIDFGRVKQAAQQAQIADFIESQPKGYNTFVGERGIRLSGGQRQRIGIARVLYKQANVLVLDEATSALDNTTEQSVMEAIEGLDRDHTILLIAHRLTTVQHCDSIVELNNGRVVAQGTYEELLGSSPSFRKMAYAAE